MTRRRRCDFAYRAADALIVVAAALGTLLAGCGHRELKAPCAPSDGASLASDYASLDDEPVLALMPVQDFARTAPVGLGPIPVSDPCGPLKPVNAGRILQPALPTGATP